MGAAWSEPATDWPEPPTARALILWPPEPVMAPDDPMPPVEFRWRRMAHKLAEARGPERIAPEWWLDDPNWRSGLRDYWQVVTESGDRLWLYYAHAAPCRGMVRPGAVCREQNHHFGCRKGLKNAASQKIYSRPATPRNPSSFRLIHRHFHK